MIKKYFTRCPFPSCSLAIALPNLHTDIHTHTIHTYSETNASAEALLLVCLSMISWWEVRLSFPLSQSSPFLINEDAGQYGCECTSRHWLTVLWALSETKEHLIKLTDYQELSPDYCGLSWGWAHIRNCLDPRAMRIDHICAPSLVQLIVICMWIININVKLVSDLQFDQNSTEGMYSESSRFLMQFLELGKLWNLIWSWGDIL